MYPLDTPSPYPRRQWWMAAWSTEVGRSVLGRTIQGEKVVLYRTESGEAVCTSGICPHRMYPLEKGRLVGDSLQCAYHGITFDASGRCTHGPSQEAVAPAALRRYPVLERAGTVWIWTGEPEAADPRLMPPLDEVGMCDGWRIDKQGPIDLDARYTLLIDNLLDLSHVSFIHADTIPGAEAVARVPCEPVGSSQSFNNRRLGRGIPSSPYLQMLFPEYEGPVDQHFDAEYFGPCMIRTGGHFLIAGTEQKLGTVNFLHLITPETPTSTRYFVATVRNFRTDDEPLSQFYLASGNAIAPQDKEAITSIEHVLRTGQPLPREISVKADLGSVQVRKRLTVQIRAESVSAEA
ncbi:aromatic ring-hydroxylating dioxygenase subunit alpha [Burkholderia sp. B21-007]|uniref:aromatic ring-hydroxylating dioxygenase subunit alpha n=1 Tax=Burkholderia sp. B21-007 TaxID=2890407 RepID=UPI001E5BC93F|nr:aromatic ring-hydroxylating dioxygenase subunit alpha [Burkholderia sp. B21-007]UEP30830.1 aromatic ring-hydroxylating dioxygenase subunit alpha [Burkholderia sp. B21-007]